MPKKIKQNKAERDYSAVRASVSKRLKHSSSDHPAGKNPVPEVVMIAI